jgi:hypothetical protein
VRLRCRSVGLEVSGQDHDRDPRRQPGARDAARALREGRGGRSRPLPVPSLAAAIVLKAGREARQAPRDAEDLACLVDVVEDVEVVRVELKPAERRSLGSGGLLAYEGARAWRAAADADDARAAFVRLAD